jgi:hypothetical protein
MAGDEEPGLRVRGSTEVGTVARLDAFANRRHKSSSACDLWGVAGACSATPQEQLLLNEVSAELSQQHPVDSEQHDSSDLSKTECALSQCVRPTTGLVWQRTEYVAETD